MTKREQIQLFEDRKVRTAWDYVQEKWYFSIVDVVEVLTDSADPTDYLKKMRKREPELGIYIGTNCPQVVMTTFTGMPLRSSAHQKKKRPTLFGQPLFWRCLAGPFLLYLAKVGLRKNLRNMLI